jgi:hypothetical protein
MWLLALAGFSWKKKKKDVTQPLLWYVKHKFKMKGKGSISERTIINITASIASFIYTKVLWDSPPSTSLSGSRRRRFCNKKKKGHDYIKNTK